MRRRARLTFPSQLSWNQNSSSRSSSSSWRRSSSLSTAPGACCSSGAPCPSCCATLVRGVQRVPAGAASFDSAPSLGAVSGAAAAYTDRSGSATRHRALLLTYTSAFVLQTQKASPPLCGRCRRKSGSWCWRRLTTTPLWTLPQAARTGEAGWPPTAPTIGAREAVCP